MDPLIALLCLLTAPIAAHSERSIRFDSGDVSLSGSLLLPRGNGPFPAVALLPGSGPQTREWLRPIAQRLSDEGFASLVFDKRGCGHSTGSWTSASLDDLARDGTQAMQALMGQPEVNRARVGLFAISQSGWYAPLVARAEPATSFLVVVTGGGATPREVEWYGYERRLQRRGVSSVDLQRARQVLRVYFDYLATGVGLTDLNRMLEEAKGSPWADALGLERVLPGPQTRPSWAWVATFDPAPSIEALRIPVLLLFGGQDDLLPTDVSLERWTSSLRRSEAHPTVRIFPEADHAMTVGGHHLEQIRHPEYAIGYLETLVAWVRAVTNRQ